MLGLTSSVCMGYYCRSGKFCVMKLLYDKFSCGKIFVGMHINANSMHAFS